MAQIPPITRLSSEDFKEQAGWIEKLIQPINQYFERTTSALNRSLTVKDNMAGDQLVVEFNGTFPVRVAWTAKAKPASVFVGNTVRSDGTSFTLTAAVQVQWSFNQAGQLQIDAVVGITPTATTKYKVTLTCLS